MSTNTWALIQSPELEVRLLCIKVADCGISIALDLLAQKTFNIHLPSQTIKIYKGDMSAVRSDRMVSGTWA